MNGLDLGRKAVSLFQANRGGESLYLQCQRFDGFYTQAAWQDNWDVASYDSARVAIAAAQAAGRIYTTDLNDSRIEAGEKVYYRWGVYDHVCNIVGRDSGGLIVTNTANAGDDLGQLGNHVKLSHAHTLGLELVGVSSRDGNNTHITGVDLWLPGGAAPQPAAPSGNRVELDNWAWYTSPGEAQSTRNPHGRRWTGEPYMNGNYELVGIEGNGALKVRANDGSIVWVHSDAQSRITSGGGAPAAKPLRIVLDGWAWFTSAGEAQAMQNPHGPKWTGERLMNGDYAVQAVEGNGAIRVTANDGSTVWVNSQAAGAIY